jgi:N-acetyl sugar amidotransferase
MRYCTRCLYPENHPLNLTFDTEGVCSGCRVHEEKDSLDWNQRNEKLGKLLSRYRNKSGNNYDCIIPVSGARDSYFIVHTIKKLYKMNPLLVTYNKQYNTSMGIRNLAYLRTLMDCDCLTMTVNPFSVRKITRVTLERFASMYWHCIAGQTVFPVRIATRFKIPLIVWGAHQGCDQVGMFSQEDEVEMTRKYRKEHDLMGLEAEDLMNSHNELSEQDINQFIYPHDKEIERVGVRGVYLSNFIRWDSKKQHEKMIDLYGYETGIQQRTFDTYNDVDCFHYSGIHDYIKSVKLGYGKVTDHACREIRLGRLSREEGIELVKKYQIYKAEDVGPFLRWLDIAEKEFFGYIESKRDREIWETGGNGNWVLKDSIDNHINDPGINKVRLDRQEACKFLITPSRDSKKDSDQYILIGKGYVEN